MRSTPTPRMAPYLRLLRLGWIYWLGRILNSERTLLRLEQRLLPVDRRIFDDTIDFYREVHGQHFTWQEALERARNKALHKDAWFHAPRESERSIREFYASVHVYPFRQPLNWRYAPKRWLLDLVRDLPGSNVLEYGCGSAVMTEHLLHVDGGSHVFYVADVPSVTLEFVRWKRARHGYPIEILEIGEGPHGIPLDGLTFGLIVCVDVLEHTPNPLDIVRAFVDSLEPGGVLVVDFLDAPGGENLEAAVVQRPAVLALLRAELMPLKGIDWLGKNNGAYVKPGRR